MAEVNKKSKNNNMPKFCVFFFIIGFLGYNMYNTYQFKDNIRRETLLVAEKHGLEDISIMIGGKVPELAEYDYYYVTVYSSNLEELSFNALFQLDEELDKISNAYIESYKSNGDIFSISPYLQSVYKNGEQIYDDYWNSDSQKSIQGNGSSSSGSSSSGSSSSGSSSSGSSFSNSNNGSTNSNTLVTGDKKTQAWVCSQDIVKSSLKSPSTADFCSITEAKVYSNGGQEYTIEGYVDSENGFGAEVRTNFTVTLTMTTNGYKNGYVTFR